MTESELHARSWTQLKRFFPAVVSAGLMYGGIHQIIDVLKYVLTDAILQFMNALIRRAFPDTFPLPDRYGRPWGAFQVHQIEVATIGLIVVSVGALVGFWTRARTLPRATM